MRAARKDSVTGVKIPGEQVIGALLERRVVLIAMVIDPHGKWGPDMDWFLFHIQPRKLLTFKDYKPNAAEMYRRVHDVSCPSGIIPAACAVWRQTKDRRFFGHSYTTPTPREHTLQQLGLVVTKAYGLHLRNATRRMGAPPPDPHRAPTELEGDDESVSSDVDEIVIPTVALPLMG